MSLFVDTWTGIDANIEPGVEAGTCETGVGNARLVYAATALTIDMAFAAAYGLLSSILLFRLFRLPLYLLPLALASADALENVTIAALALSHAGAPTPLASLAAAFTLLKWLLCAATLSATAAGVLNWLRVRIRR